MAQGWFNTPGTVTADHHLNWRRSRAIAYSWRWESVRIFAGLVLLTAATAKTVELAAQDGNVARGQVLTSALTFGEVLLGVCILSGRCALASVFAAMFCFATFAGVAFSKAFTGQTSCQCFSSFVEMSPWLTAALDLVLALALWACLQHKQSTGAPAPLAACARLPLVPAIVVVVTTLVWTVVDSPATLADDGTITLEGEAIVVKSDGWVGKRLPLMSFIDIGDLLECGEWTLIFYRRDCPKCDSLLSQYRKGLLSQGSPPVALIEVPPFGHDIQNAAVFTDVSGRLSDKYVWLLDTPLIVHVNQGVVTRTSQGNEVQPISQHTPMSI